MSKAERRPPAVVVGLDCITGLQSARLLADRGVPVITIAADPAHFCSRTRVPQGKFTAPTEGDGLIRALEILSHRLPGQEPPFLLPCTDGAVLTISAQRERLAGLYRFVLPDHAVIERLIDKVAFAEHAAANNLPTPPTIILRNRRDAQRAVRRLHFPAVLKPALKTPAWVDGAGGKVIRVERSADLLSAYDRARHWSTALIAQSWIGGGEEALYSCNAYFDRQGLPLVTFVARKIRQWPPYTGTSSLGVEVRDDAVLNAAIDLFSSVNYRGLAYLELKRDERDGSYNLIEANPGRPTGRSAIAEKGGVELLLTAYCDAVGLPLPEAREQRYVGVKWIYWRHDLQAAAAAMRRGELGLRGWVASISGPSIEAVGSLRDPLPTVAELGYVAAAAGRSLRSTLSRFHRL